MFSPNELIKQMFGRNGSTKQVFWPAETKAMRFYGCHKYSDGKLRWAHANRIVVKPCNKNLRPGIRNLEQSTKCAPHPGESARSPRRVWALQKSKQKPLPTLPHTAMSDQGGPAVPAVPPPTPAATVCPNTKSLLAPMLLACTPLTTAPCRHLGIPWPCGAPPFIAAPDS